VATSGVLGWQVLQARGAEDARGEALAAAQGVVPKVLSYDYRHISRDFAEAREGLTPGFGAKYAKSENVVGPTARQYDVAVEASVAESSVVRADTDSAVVLMYVNQETSSDRLEGPRMDLARVRVTMVESDGEWLVDDLDAL
ncbi:MAG: hypothetical protein ACRDYU_08250, partial [Actinomycetes bacterium]